MLSSIFALYVLLVIKILVPLLHYAFPGTKCSFYIARNHIFKEREKMQTVHIRLAILPAI